MPLPLSPALSTWWSAYWRNLISTLIIIYHENTNEFWKKKNILPAEWRIQEFTGAVLKDCGNKIPQQHTLLLSVLFINTCKYTFNFILRQRWYRSGAHQMPLAENWRWLKIHKVNPDHGINTFLFLFSLSHEISILFFYYFPFEFYSLYTWKTLGTALIANRDWMKINQKLKQFQTWFI